MHHGNKHVTNIPNQPKNYQLTASGYEFLTDETCGCFLSASVSAFCIPASSFPDTARTVLYGSSPLYGQARE